jgi:hypothetical protein
MDVEMTHLVYQGFIQELEHGVLRWHGVLPVINPVRCSRRGPTNGCGNDHLVYQGFIQELEHGVLRWHGVLPRQVQGTAPTLGGVDPKLGVTTPAGKLYKSLLGAGVSG